MSNSNVLARLTRGATRVARRMRHQKHSPRLGRELFDQPLKPRCRSGLTTLGEPEQFVVMATGATGTYWLSGPNDKGVHLLVPPERAALFQSPTDAGAAIHRTPPAFRGAGIVFTVETIKR
jgi:hypothetical protein